MAKKEKFIRPKRGKAWFRALKCLMVGRYKKPEFIYLGEKMESSSIMLSNHVGTEAPMSLEMYMHAPIRFWGAHEMNSGLIKMYKYQSRVYYHEKKHWNLHLARLFCLIASPLTNLFYAGLNLISTYKDSRFYKTLKESLDALKKGQNIVVFPEDSTNGYLDELEGFFLGFLALAEFAYKKGIDTPIFVSYLKKDERVYIIDKPIKYSELIADGLTKEEIAKKLLGRCNELGKADLNELRSQASVIE
ncbi:MAG: hypothetical protein J6V68_03240 [Clostridia bacterium]|nr:hypothetical protein [Clostridia bacterium]